MNTKITEKLAKLIKHEESARGIGNLAEASYSRDWKKSFLSGFAQAVGGRMLAQYREATQAAEAETVQSVGLVHLRNKETLVKGFMQQQKYGKSRAGSSGGNGSAYRAGAAAGGSVSLAGKALR